MTLKPLFLLYLSVGARAHACVRVCVYSVISVIVSLNQYIYISKYNINTYKNGIGFVLLRSVERNRAACEKMLGSFQRYRSLGRQVNGKWLANHLDRHIAAGRLLRLRRGRTRRERGYYVEAGAIADYLSSKQSDAEHVSHPSPEVALLK